MKTTKAFWRQLDAVLEEDIRFTHACIPAREYVRQAARTGRTPDNIWMVVWRRWLGLNLVKAGYIEPPYVDVDDRIGDLPHVPTLDTVTWYYPVPVLVDGVRLAYETLR